MELTNTLTNYCMKLADKRYPAFSDLDTIWFGKYQGTALQDIPAPYLNWLWNTYIHRRRNGEY